MLYFAPRSRSLVSVAAAVMGAQHHDRSLRVETGQDRNGSWIKLKVGEGMWSPPIYQDQDPNVPVQHVTIVE